MSLVLIFFLTAEVQRKMTFVAAANLVPRAIRGEWIGTRLGRSGFESKWRVWRRVSTVRARHCRHRAIAYVIFEYA